MKVPPERSNASLEELIVSSATLCTISLKGLTLLRLTKLSPEGLNVSSGG